MCTPISGPEPSVNFILSSVEKSGFKYSNKRMGNTKTQRSLIFEDLEKHKDNDELQEQNIDLSQEKVINVKRKYDEITQTKSLHTNKSKQKIKFVDMLTRLHGSRKFKDKGINFIWTFYLKNSKIFINLK